MRKKEDDDEDAEEFVSTAAAAAAAEELNMDYLLISLGPVGNACVAVAIE